MAGRKSTSSAPVVASSPDTKGKGKAVMLSAPALMEKDRKLDENDLLDLADKITATAGSLAPGNHDITLSNQAKEVVKASFDRALQSEALSFPHLAALLQSLTPAAGPSTRSSKALPAPVTSALALSITPLAELTTIGMDDEMIWEQMEMRGRVVVELLEEMFGAGGNGRRGEGDDDEEMMEGGEIEGEDDEESDSEEDSDKDDGDEYEDDEEEGEEEEEEDEDEGEQLPFKESAPYFKTLTGASIPGEDEDESEPEYADPNRSLTLASFDTPGSGKGRRANGPPSVVDDAFFSLHDFHVQIDEGEAEMTKAMRGEPNDDDDDDDDQEDDVDLFAAVGNGNGSDDDEDEEEDLDGTNIMYSDFFDPPPRPFTKEKPPPKAKKGKSRRPPPVGELAPPSDSEETTVAVKQVERKRSIRFSEAVKVKTIPARGSEFDKLVNKVGWAKAMEITEAKEAGFTVEGDDEDQVMEDESPFGEEQEEDDEMTLDDEDEMLRSLAEEEGDEEEEEEGSDEYESEDQEGRETIDRLKSSLFDDDEDDSGDENATPAAQLSRHERRLLALSSQIASLEAENVGMKNWATKGEAKSKDRPVNSLLEEDLEYERSGKVVPIITEETTKTIEELIKKRIIDNQFDDVVRQREIDPNAFLPSRFMELQDSKSNKSLAEIYEEDYSTSKEKEAGRTVVHQLDKDLEKKHSEIEDLFDELSGKLDALSNARFTPKPPKASITTISNVASITLESALPTGTATSTLLAPEEVFVADPTNEDRSDFTPSMKKQARQKRRKARASMAKTAEKFSKGTKGEKEKATKELIGTKGVTVIGKGGKIEGDKKRKRSNDDEGANGRMGINLKL